MTADTALARAAALAGTIGNAGRSEAYAWLRLRFEQLASRLQHRPGWPAVAAGMALGGIKGGRGKPLTGPALRRIWSRVCRDVAAEESWRLEAVRDGFAARGAGMQAASSRTRVGTERGSGAANRGGARALHGIPRPSAPGAFAIPVQGVCPKLSAAAAFTGCDALASECRIHWA